MSTRADTALADVTVGKEILIVAWLVVHRTRCKETTGIDGAAVLGAEIAVITSGMVGLMVAHAIDASVDGTIEVIGTVIVRSTLGRGG